MEATGELTPDRVLRRLEWQVIRRLDGRMQGDHRTASRGVGTDLLDVREYAPGDDVRHIDWNVTARMDTLFVREFAEDRELTAWLLLDRSPSMSFGPVERPKERVLCELAVTLARLLTRGGDRIGALVYDNAIESTLPPRSGRAQVLLLARELLRPLAPRGDATALDGLLHRAAETVRRRSLVILVSDFISEPGWERPLLRLAERHEVVAIRLVDPSERDLPDAGLIYVEDAETGEQLLVDTSDPELRARLREAVAARDHEVRSATRRCGIELFDVSTNDDLTDAVLRLLRARRRSGRSA